MKETSIYNVRLGRNAKFSELSLLWKKCFSKNKMYMLGKCSNQCASCYVQNSITVNEICSRNSHKLLWKFSQLCPWKMDTYSFFFIIFLRKSFYQSSRFSIHLCVDGIYSTQNVGLLCKEETRYLSTTSVWDTNNSLTWTLAPSPSSGIELLHNSL